MLTTRRFLIAPSLSRLIRRGQRPTNIIQGYFPTQTHRNAHVQLEDDAARLILEVKDAHGGAFEEPTAITVDQGRALVGVTAGVVELQRVVLPVGPNQFAYIDQLSAPGELHLASVDFESPRAAASFRPTAWFGPDVSADERFSFRALALGGIPPISEVPLSNAALDAALDAMEFRP